MFGTGSLTQTMHRSENTKLKLINVILLFVAAISLIYAVLPEQ